MLFTQQMRGGVLAVGQSPGHRALNLPGYAACMNLRLRSSLLLAIVFAFPLARAEDSVGVVPANLDTARIVAEMQRHSLAQTATLGHYQALRHYQVEYRGFAARLAARMDVEVNYDAVAGKTLQIVSQSGSGFLCEKVLKRAVDSEREAFQDKRSNAITEANYRFQLAGTDIVAGRPAYILNAQPITASKFLFRGKIWVDATDFAVVKMETEPAKSPSFWISRTLIHSTSAKTGDFWLPRQVRSETKVRLGGTAVLTIDFGTYQVQPATQLQAALP